MERKKSGGEAMEIKRYFGNAGDEKLAKVGWTLQGDGYDEAMKHIKPFEVPSGLKAIEIGADNMPEGRFRNYLIYDPAKAEVTVVRWGNPGARETQRALVQDGWEIVDGNVSRSIFVRTKKESPTN